MPTLLPSSTPTFLPTVPRGSPNECTHNSRKPNGPSNQRADDRHADDRDADYPDACANADERRIDRCTDVRTVFCGIILPAYYILYSYDS